VLHGRQTGDDLTRRAAGYSPLNAFEVTAQETTTGSIAGQVVYPQGLPIPGASVEIISGQGTKEIVTDELGRFAVPFLAPGQDTVPVRLQGVRTVEQGPIDLHPSRDRGPRPGARGSDLEILMGKLERRLELLRRLPNDVSSEELCSN
jgi:hypothetical protein